MTNCSKCGTALAVFVELETDYSKTKAILDAKVSGADLTNEQLACLKWKQSQRKPALSTIRVDEPVLGVPTARELYDRLKASPNLSLKLSEITYRLSRNHEGTTEWLQRWSPVS